ncbi:MAG TPA: hypothetical protein VNZ61_02660 [Roseomonas sp.]|nr:hypothetical protein [Roseomonas sp.]
MHGANVALKDESREYWTRRAETFDLSPGHSMKILEQRDAWAALLRRHMVADAQRVRELAFGTGEVTRVLLGMGCEVTGWT